MEESCHKNSHGGDKEWLLLSWGLSGGMLNIAPRPRSTRPDLPGSPHTAPHPEPPRDRLPGSPHMTPRLGSLAGGPFRGAWDGPVQGGGKEVNGRGVGVVLYSGTR